MWWYAAIPACGTLMCIASAEALSSAARGQIDMPREIAKLD
jgi:TRAP-type C4-dicarboxylate transport system permease small subunit